MQNLSAAQLKHLKRGGQIGINITVALLDGDPIVLTEADIRSLTIDRNSVSGSVLEIGNSETSELSFELKNNTGAFSAVRWEGARLTVVLSIGGEPLQVGVFTVDEQPRKTKTMVIRALDDMARFNRLYVPGITYPATLAQILADACNQCSVNQYTLTFDNCNYTVDTPPDGGDITCHHIVSWVAELAGCNAWIDQLGRLNLSWYGDNQTGSLSLGLGDMFAYEMDEGDITITGIVYHTEDADHIVGTDDYALVIEDNPLLQTDFEVVLNALQSKLGGFTYRPYAFSCRGYPHLWPGDIINELTDADGHVISSIITNHRYTVNGRSDLKAVGETETVRGYATGAPFTASQKRVLRAVAQVEASRQTSSLEQATLALNELMVNSLGFYTTVVNDAGGGKIVYTHDKPVLQESQIIWTRTEQGFAWTDKGWNGGNPVWQYGVASDGSMVIKLLTAVGINADWIRLEPHANLLNDSSQVEVEFFGGVAAPVTFFTVDTESRGLLANEVVTASVNLTVYDWEGQIRLLLVFYNKNPAHDVLTDPAVISYVSSGDIYADGTYSVTGRIPAGTKIIKLQARPYYPDMAPYIGGTYKELQLERGGTATPWKPYPSEESLEGYMNSIANGTHYGGSFLSGRMIYSPNVIGMQGTFKDLLAGTPGGARLELGESAGDPFLRAFGDNGALRAELLKDKLEFSDEQGNFAGEISGGTVDGSAAMILRAFAIITGLGNNVFFNGNTYFNSNMYGRIDGVNKQLHTIIDSGSNENGSWIKYSDGNMECWHEFVYAGVNTSRASYQWTFPAPFSGTTGTSVTCTMENAGTTTDIKIIPGIYRNLTTTGVRLDILSSLVDMSSISRPGTARAIGKWRV